MWSARLKKPSQRRAIKETSGEYACRIHSIWCGGRRLQRFAVAGGSPRIPGRRWRCWKPAARDTGSSPRRGLRVMCRASSTTGLSTQCRKQASRPGRLSAAWQGLAAPPRSMPWSNIAATAATTIMGVAGNDGWSFADVLPYFKRRKTCRFRRRLSRQGAAPRQQMRTDNPVQQTFLQAGREPSFGSARISMPRITKASASIR